jgi:uncharacterized protein
VGNPVSLFQIISKAPEDTAAFYGQLFGWKITADNAMGYRQIDTGSPDGIQGGIWPAPPQAVNSVQLFVTVPDVAASTQRAGEMGARVIIAPTTLPEGQTMAVLHDPHGMPFALCSAFKV